MMHAAVAQLSSQPLLLRHYCISSSRVLPESAFPITIYVTRSAKTSLTLGVHKAGFRREGHIYA